MKSDDIWVDRETGLWVRLGKQKKKQKKRRDTKKGLAI